MSHKVKTYLSNLAVAFIVISSLVFALFPFYWAVATSIKPNELLFQVPPAWVFEPTTKNYELVFKDWKVANFLTNSVIVTSISSLLCVGAGTLAAFALARFKFRGRESLASELLSIRMFPPVVVAIPIFILAYYLNLLNTYTILVLVYATFNIPIVTIIMRSFIDEIPIEIEESGMIDGCTRLTAFLRITLPLCRDAILSVLVLSAIFSWNEFLFGTILTRMETRTLPVIAGQTMTQRGIDWGPAAALTIITAGPMLLFGMLIQKYLVRGMTFGAVKG